MRIVLLIPGTGHFFCGSCLRDNTLAAALRRRGHDVSVVPLYLPMVLEEGESGDVRPLRMGGINLYLEHRSALFRRIPRDWTRFLDRPSLLRMSSRLGDMTDAHKLGAITLSTLLGDAGPIAKEVDDLVASLEQEAPFDCVLLSNVMLVGVARRIKERLRIPVVCTLQGEAPFLDALDEPFRSDAWRLLRERAKDLDRMVAVSHYYGALMQERLGLEPGRIVVVWNGIDFDGLHPAEPPTTATIGYLARMCEEKGLATLVDAFVLLHERHAMEDARLKITGVKLSEDAPFVARQMEKLARVGLADRVEVFPNVDRVAKIEFLRSLTVLSVPATYGESFGLYLLEALACGVPLVQPRHAAFPELIEATQGGTLVDPNDPSALAEGLAAMLRDREAARLHGTRGRERVLAQFSSDRMAAGVEEVLHGL